MGKGAQKADLDRLAKGLLVLAPDPDSEEFKTLRRNAVKRLNDELRSGKSVNDALCSALRAEACNMKHQLTQAIQAACVKDNFVGRQQASGIIYARTRVIKEPRYS